MRFGLYSEEGYPLHNCTQDTLRVLLKSSDPEIVNLGKRIEAKKRRPRFGGWIEMQRERKDGVGDFARWLWDQQKDGRWCGRLIATPPEQLFNHFLKARTVGVDFPEKAERGLAQALEEWDRWDVTEWSSSRSSPSKEDQQRVPR